MILSEGANQGVSKSVTDRAGNVANAGQSGINIDETSPTLGTFGYVRDAAGKKIVAIRIPLREELSGFSENGPANPGNYELMLRKGRKVRPVPLRVPIFDMPMQTVTLTPVKSISAKKLASYSLTVHSTPDLADRAGNLFDGDRDGRPGGDFIRPLSQVLAATAQRRAIDELLASRGLHGAIHLEGY